MPTPVTTSLYETMEACMECADAPNNASTACMGGYSWWHFAYSRIAAATTHGEQLGTSIGRGWQRSPRAAPVTVYERRWKHAGMRDALNAFTACMEYRSAHILGT